MASLGSILRVNATTCLAGGAALLVAPEVVGALLGDAPPAALGWLGGALILNGIHLVRASFRRAFIPIEILWFSVGDFSWWLATLALIGSGQWITSGTGITVALLVAVAVAALGVMQLACLGAARSGLTGAGQWGGISRSWLALPTWVKLWLLALNVIFLMSPAFLPWSKAATVLLAYMATGPLLLGFAAFRGGMTRDMGIGHLIPWTPLLIWLFTVPPVASLGSTASVYLFVLGWTTAVCLAFDIYDLGRWLKGDRQVLTGSKSKGPAWGRDSG